MKGIAITLATREDSEAVAGIEKLLGTRIAREGSSKPDEAEAPRQEKRQPRPKRQESAEKPAAAKRAPREDRQPPEERSAPSPVVEDIEPDWNGPLPSFLSVGAA